MQEESNQAGQVGYSACVCVCVFHLPTPHHHPAVASFLLWLNGASNQGSAHLLGCPTTPKCDLDSHFNTHEAADATQLFIRFRCKQLLNLQDPNLPHTEPVPSITSHFSNPLQAHYIMRTIKPSRTDPGPCLFWTRSTRSVTRERLAPWITSLAPCLLKKEEKKKNLRGCSSTNEKHLLEKRAAMCGAWAAVAALEFLQWSHDEEDHYGGGEEQATKM